MNMPEDNGFALGLEMIVFMVGFGIVVIVVGLIVERFRK